MSGGKDRKSKSSSKTQGWEQAEDEFYQESYPGDLENFQRDPSAIATLLPSKQNRYASTRRIRGGQTDTKTVKKRTNTMARRRNSISTVRRGSQYHEAQGAMLPDLSENFTDEERKWEEIHEIKSMPISMREKKEVKAQLQNATTLRLQGLDQIKWQRRKVWQRMEVKWREYISKMELWKNSLKKIEGNFGTGIVAYFLFLRWLMFLNLFIFLLVFVFIAIPQFFFTEPTDIPCDATEMPSNSIQCCAEKYFSVAVDFNVLDVIQGTGFMERTYMFYGKYSNKIFGFDVFWDDNTSIEAANNVSNTLTFYNNYNNNSVNYTMSSQEEGAKQQQSSSTGLYYDLPLAYILITLTYFLLSLGAIVKAVAREFKERLVEGEGQFYQYCNLIFGGWDFCIHNEKSAHIKHKALFNEIKGILQSKRIQFERQNRSRDVMLKLIAIRLVVNLVVLSILIAAGYLIYVLFTISLAYLEPGRNANQLSNQLQDTQIEYVIRQTGNAEIENILGTRTSKVGGDESFENQFTNLFFEFLPYLAIVLLNVLIPLIFNYLVAFEKYSPMFVIKMTLFRTVFLRLSSLGVLLSRFYYLVTADVDGECYNEEKSRQCWETFVGQQFYKLFITDFATHIFITFFINFPRAFFAKHVHTKLARFIGEQEFELPKHVLDVVYSQTLCWLGSFYAPFLPAIATVLTFLMFYIKKFACLYNSKPSSVLYRASRSNSLFMFVLLVSFALVTIAVAFAIAEILPSRSCGPFRGLSTVWESAINAFMKLPSFLQNLVFFLGTAGFAVPCFIVLSLLLYYNYAVSAANKHMVVVLKNQLILEGHDKQFLLNRLSSFLRQQQEYQRRAEGRQPKERDRDKRESN